jgi:4'-phosphopantetheinyl transferase
MKSTRSSKELCSFRETAPDRPRLTLGEVHVLRFSTEAYLPELDLFRRVLTRDETSRADQLRFSSDRAEFILARAMLRFLLGTYLERDPRSITFCHNRWGKPFLAEPESGIFFNVSHSEGLVLYALAQGGDVGVDVEGVSSSDISRPFSFFAEWTYREALTKAPGRGVFDPPTWDALPGWSFLSLFPGPRYAAVLAVQGFESRITCWDWKPKLDALKRSLPSD